jgi:8-oxo-dGTP pyrophosphatase MutT (NUDIX family)
MRTITRDIVGAFIFSRDGKLLMGKSHKGGVYSKSWIIPGGGVEDGETKIEALRREILEETGIDIKSSEVSKIEGALRGQSEKNLRDTGERLLVNMDFYNYKVIIDKDSSDITLKADDDFVDARWFSQPELAAVQMSPPSVETLRKLGYL